jgi:hypothetical protein
VGNAIAIPHKSDLPIDAPLCKEVIAEYPELMEFPLNGKGQED